MQAMAETELMCACCMCGRPGELHRSLDGTVLPFCPNHCHWASMPKLVFRRFPSEAEAIEFWNELDLAKVES